MEKEQNSKIEENINDKSLKAQKMIQKKKR